MSDIYVDSNWCPDCGEPRGVCRCLNEQPAKEYEANEQRAQEILASCFGDAHVLARVLAISEIDAAQDKTMLNSLRRTLEAERAKLEVTREELTALRDLLFQAHTLLTFGGDWGVFHLALEGWLAQYDKLKGGEK